MNRFRIACALSALAVSLSLVSPVPASATFPAKNGLIAFGADTGNGTQLFTVRRNGHDLRQITHGPGEATTPDWSPDGQWLAYSLDECTIALVRADGRSARHPVADSRRVRDRSGVHTRRRPFGLRALRRHRGRRRDLDHGPQRQRSPPHRYG